MSEQYGQFELVKKLATGGMAQIYLARHRGIEGFERLCVVKRILPHLAENDDFIKMFLDEAKIAARLNHPNIVQIHDLGTQADSFFLAMEYIHGEDLRRIWKRADAQGIELPVAFVLRVIADAAAGLDYAHKRVDNGRALNIVHRDISPQNILVSFEGGVKVVDFGIAKAADKMTHTRSGVLKGKYSYMSPEQAAGSHEFPVDHRTDIFALGIVLYELLTGTRLFKRSNDIQTLNSVMECKVAPPSEVNARVPKDLDPVVMKALQRSPDDRYRDARALQLAIEDWLVAHQLPSSTAHVAEFMRGLYQDRLAEEQSVAGVVIPEAVPEIKSAEEDLSPRGQRRTGGGSRPRTNSAVQRTPPDEATSSLRGPSRSRSNARPSGKAPTVSLRSGAAAQSEPPPPPRRTLPPETIPRVTEVTAPGRGRSTKIAIAVAMLVGVAALAVMVLRPTAPASLATVTVETDPPGATLVFNDRPVPTLSPTTLPQVPEGQYTLRVGKARFVDQRLTINVPASGEVKLPLIVLAPMGAPKPPVDSGPAVVARANVKVALEAVPAGARLFVDGQPAGPAPVVREWLPGTQVTVRAELPGFESAERQVVVGESPEQTERFELAKVQRVTQVKQTERTDPDREKTNPTPRAVGNVRFVVMPLGAWAEVSCGNHNFGATPFGDKQLPAGTYECTFTNPDLGTRRERVEVRANDLAKVTVKF